MAILNFQLSEIGQTGQEPKFIYLNTNNTVAQVTAAGYLNKFVAQGNTVAETDMAVVATRATPGAKSVAVNLFNVSYSSGNWSLTANSTPLVLANDQVFIGNASGVATGVTVSGDATISNTGVLTIANSAVTLAKLASGVAPAYIVKFAGKQADGGGSATVAISAAGVLTSDIVFAQIQASTNAVTVQKVTPTADTVTVLLSGDPGAATTISYQVLRAAA